MTIPEKLHKGDEIRVVSPASSLAVIHPEVRQTALQNLAGLGLQVSFARNAEECDTFSSSSIASRVDDLHCAFADPNIRGILTTRGGFNSNQLLRYLDYRLIQANPKVLCGYSDITALAAAIHAKTGLVTYSGAHFSTFGMQQGLAYTREYFQKCLMETAPYAVMASETWSDDRWFDNQNKRTFYKNKGWVVIHPGHAEGTLIGGNLCTLNLLQGTEYMPSLEGSILLVEDDYESKPLTFDRDLQSLLHQPGFSGVRGMVIGRFQKRSQMSHAKLVEIIQNKAELAGMPVVVQADFGHTTPQFTFPIGGSGVLSTGSEEVFRIVEH